MKTHLRFAFAALVLSACDGPRAVPATASPEPATASSLPGSASASATAVAAVLGSSTPAASAALSASASASPCPDGARKDDDARYCITLPAKKLAVSYEGDKPSKGITEELEVAGDKLVITVGPAPSGKTVAQLKEAALARIGAALVESGDLPDGYWTDLKAKDGQHIVDGTVVSKYIITCTHWVRDEKRLEAARAVCKSLRTF